ncbi:MAG: hypothetical protein NC826_04625 [Candidatus Omnitrophica bacterium]|nr:hypothetical protein [Candidatus Omnitrophota bacterium]
MDKLKIRYGVLLLVIISLTGCATAKGLGEGVVKTAYGMVEDTRNFWDTLVKTDRWMQKNLW